MNDKPIHRRSPREQSLLRSFSAIHDHSPSPPSASFNDFSRREGSFAVDGNDSRIKIDRRGKAKDIHGHQRRAVTHTLPNFGDLPPPPLSRHVSASSLEQEQAKKFPRRSSSTANKPRRAPQASTSAAIYNGIRQDYFLGETIRCPSHMIIQSSHQATHPLKKHDFVWIKRSDGSFSYAILAYRTERFSSSTKSSINLESMTFVISAQGSTKTIRKKHWAEYIRLVSTSTTVDEQGLYDLKAYYNSSSVPVPKPSIVRASKHFEFNKSLDAAIFCQEIPTARALCQEGSNQDIEVNIIPFPFFDNKEDCAMEDGDVPPSMITFDTKKVLDEECSMLSSVSFKARMAYR